MTIPITSFFTSPVLVNVEIVSNCREHFCISLPIDMVFSLG